MQENEKNIIRFGGADASPQAGSNWLLSSFWYCERSKLPELFKAINRMISHCKDRMGNRPLSMSDSETPSKTELGRSHVCVGKFSDGA